MRERFCRSTAEIYFMCELMGVSYRNPGHPGAYFKMLRAHEPDNPDGWGYALYPDQKSALLFKEPVPALSSPLAEYLETYYRLTSKIFIAHIRQASQGASGKVFSNTHPFLREHLGKDYLFAHNGNLENFRDLPLGNFHPVGDTDSEHAFCYLMGRIAKGNIAGWEKSNFHRLRKLLQRINRLGYFNCLLSDGEYLFSYCDHEAEFQGKLRGLHLLKKPEGCVISSLPLGEGDWQKYRLGELKVFKNGEEIFSHCA